MVLGPRALDAGYGLLTAIATGTAVHLAIAASFGASLGWVAVRLATPSIAGSTALGTAAGLAFYALDVFVLFPASFPWFLGNDRLLQSLGHALLGAVTGAWLAGRRST